MKFLRINKKIITTVLVVVSFMSYAQTPYPDWKIYNSSNSPLNYDRVFEVTQDNLGNYWVGTSDGIAKFDGTNWITYITTNSSIYGRALKLFFDGTNLWIGHNVGISKFDGTTFTYYDLDNIFSSYYQGCNTIKGFDKDKLGNIWIATGNGLVKYNGTTFIQYHIQNGSVSDNKIWSVKCDTVNNVVFVGTYNAGIQKFNGTTFTKYLFNDTITNPNTIIQWGDFQQVNRIAFDNQGDIWATGYGINKFDRVTMQRQATFNSANTNQGVGDPLVWGIAIDQNNKLWIGSDCLKGIFMKDNNGFWTTYNELNSPIPQNTCYHGDYIYVDKNNNKIISMDGIGLVFYKEGGVALGIHDELKSNIDINLFPNPVADKLIISFKKEIIKTVEIVDVMGRKQNCELSESLSGYSINTTSLSTGIYFVKITTNKEAVTNKIIKE